MINSFRCIPSKSCSLTEGVFWSNPFNLQIMKSPVFAALLGLMCSIGGQTFNPEWQKCILMDPDCLREFFHRTSHKPGPLSEFFGKNVFSCCYVFEADDCLEKSLGKGCLGPRLADNGSGSLEIELMPDYSYGWLEDCPLKQDSVRGPSRRIFF